MPDELLRVENLSCERGYRLLFEQLNFSIHAGQLVQIAGENGSGKSTLLKLLSGLSTDYSGDIYWQNKPLSQVKDDYHSQMCFLGHAKAVKQRLTVQENLDYYAALYPQHQKQQQQAVLAMLHLSHFRDQLCGQLSAGQQQRVALARLILSGARLWILDEPFTAIDKQGVLELERIIADKVAQGVSVLLTTHQALQQIQPHQTIQLGGR